MKDRKLVRQSGEASQKVFATTQHRKSTEDITDSGEDGSDDEPAEKLRRGALSMKSSVNITKRKDVRHCVSLYEHRDPASPTAFQHLVANN